MASNSSSPPYPTLASLPKITPYTTSLPADPRFPTPVSSNTAPQKSLLPTQVHNALFTYVRPTPVADPELLAVSPAALRDLHLAESATNDPEFLQVFSGNRVLGWDSVPSGTYNVAAPANVNPPSDIYPYAMNYGGYQFGQWASQLGDGRVVNLFTTTSPSSAPSSSSNSLVPRSYDVQLKGSGKTPYSRFADGRAVLRSSIREFLVSEGLHALQIPTTRALALILAPHELLRREKLERGAIVVRAAQSWLRFGSLELPYFRGERETLRTLADYVHKVVNELDEHQNSCKAHVDVKTSAQSAEPMANGVVKNSDNQIPDLPRSTQDSVNGLFHTFRAAARGKAPDPSACAWNRYAKLYARIVIRQAKAAAVWQAYGFLNGVLNTDNTSILGLALDFGPFAFIDIFDLSYTPNHDDSFLRYSLSAQPDALWWNCTKLGDAMAELMGANEKVDDPDFIQNGVQEGPQVSAFRKHADSIIAQCKLLYYEQYESHYEQLMAQRLGLPSLDADRIRALLTQLLPLMRDHELDYHHFFRRLGALPFAQLDSTEGTKEAAELFLPALDKHSLTRRTTAVIKLTEWLQQWYMLILRKWGKQGDAEKQRAMDAVNPKFVLRGWVLAEVVSRVEKGERSILDRVLNMTLNPFNDSWGGDMEEEERFCGAVPTYLGSLQCSCSS